jgi:hypothetical protein
MSKCTLRYILTVLVYAGVAIFLYPYLTGRLSGGLVFLSIGIGLAVVCGILRAVCMEGDCKQSEYIDAIPEPKSNQPSSTSHPHAPSHP